MTTKTAVEQELPYDAVGRETLRQQLDKALADSNFRGFSVYLGYTIPSFGQALTMNQNKVYKLTITTECNQ